MVMHCYNRRYKVKTNIDNHAIKQVWEVYFHIAAVFEKITGP
jgi:hypothetical protein